MYQFSIFNADESLRWDIDFESLNYTEELNKGLDGSIKTNFPTLSRYTSMLDTTVDLMLAGGKRTWKLFRNGSLYKRGYLSRYDVDGGSTGTTSISIYFVDTIGYLGSRHTPAYVFHDSVDSSDIAWDMIDTAQTESNGSAGITRGLDPTTVDRQRTFIHSNIRDEIVKMSNANQSNGFDFEIDNTLAFNIYYPTKGSSKPEVMFSQFNIDSFSITKPLTVSLGNRVHVIGEGNGQDTITATVNDATAQTSWGIISKVLSEKSVSRTTELETRGNQELDRLKYPKPVITITVKDSFPSITDYDLGDSVRVIIEELDFDEMLRVMKRSVQISPTGQAVINLTFEELA